MKSPAPFIPDKKNWFLLLDQMAKKLAAALSFSLFLTAAFSQPTQPDTTAGIALQNTYNQYIAVVGGGINLYNGTEYIGSYPQTEGSPFWNSRNFEKGSICYEGVVYYNVPMAYDLVRNEVVIKGFQQLALRLDESKINYFFLAGHTFRHLYTDTNTVFLNAIPEALYDLLYKGTVSLYAQREKRVERSLHAENPYLFTNHTNYFLLKGNVYYSITGKKELLNIFKAENALLKTFWKERSLIFVTIQYPKNT